MAKKKETLIEKIENHPFKAMMVFFGCGFGLCFFMMQFYYSDRINDIKDRYSDKLEQEKKTFEIELSHKILEVQQQEREKYYLRLDENSTNGKLLEKTLELIEKKGGKNDK